MILPELKSYTELCCQVSASRVSRPYVEFLGPFFLLPEDRAELQKKTDAEESFW